MSNAERRERSKASTMPPPMCNADLFLVHVTGFHFCVACQKVTELDMDGPMPVCEKCGSMRVKWCPPVPCHDLPLPSL
jgi:Zn finger protein HypA/HybF involved in hydrogenase expression